MDLDAGTEHQALSWPGGKAVARAGRFFLFAFALNYFSIRTADPDFWGHLAIGRLIWQEHSMPKADVFSYLPTRAWINYEWLANVIYFPIFQMLGEPGIVVFKTCIGIATLALIYFAARRATGEDFPITIILIPAVATIGLGFAPRAQIFTYLVFALWIYLLERARAGEHKWLFGLPFIMVLWTNLHAGFLAGLGILALYLIGQILDRRPYLPFVLSLLAAAVVTLINPYGFSYWPLLLEGITIKRPHISEWLSVPFDLATHPFFKLLLLMTLVSVIGARQWKERTPILVLLATAVLAWKVQRHMPLFGIAAGVLAPRYLGIALARLRQGAEPVSRSFGLAFATVLIVGGLVAFAGAACPDGNCSLRLDRSVYKYPQGAIKFIRERKLQGNLAVEFRWALFAIWNLHPDMKTSVDGRYETVFDPAVIAEDLDFFYGKEPKRFLRKYQTEYVLTETGPLQRFLDEDGTVELIYKDTHSRLYRTKKRYLATRLSKQKLWSFDDTMR